MTILLTHRRDVLPSRFAGLAVWLDAADLGSITRDGSDIVSQWNNNGTAVTATTINSIFNGTAAFTLFARLSSSAILTTSAFRGYIGELLFFTRALTASERALIVTYLSRKWGIAL